MSNTERPFPYDTATGITNGSIVYFGWQGLVRDGQTNETVCIIGKTKTEVVHGLIRSGVEVDKINADLITPVAMVAPRAITTKNAGRFSPLEFETAETVAKNVKTAKESVKAKTPPPKVGDEDDLI